MLNLCVKGSKVHAGFYRYLEHVNSDKTDPNSKIEICALFSLGSFMSVRDQIGHKNALKTNLSEYIVALIE